MNHLTPAMLYAFSDTIEQVKAIYDAVCSDSSEEIRPVDAHFIDAKNQNKLIDILTLAHTDAVGSYVEKCQQLDTPLGDLCRDLNQDEQFRNAPNAIYILAMLVSMSEKPHLADPVNKIIDDVYSSKLKEFLNA